MLKESVPARISPLRSLLFLCAAIAVYATVLGATAPIASATPFCDALRAELRAGSGNGGLVVTDLESGRELCVSAGDRPLILASNTKLFTTAALLDELGPRARLKTTVWAVGTLSKAGVLRGDLYLRGAGDPALAMPGFSARHRPRVATNLLALTAQVRAAGIKRVTGRLFADDSIFDRVRGVADSGYRTSPYIGPLSGLALNSGYTGVGAQYFSADPARLAADRLLRSLRRKGIAIPRGMGLGKMPRVPVASFRGKEKVTERVPAAGGRTAGAAKASASRTRTRVAVVRSPTIALLAEQINVHSDNFFAETMIKTLGALEAKAGTTAAGARVVMRHTRSLGAKATIVDGSGLTRGNRASARSVVKLLTTMAASETGEVFRNTLPLSTRDGTLVGRMKGTPAERNCEAKTGTLTGVSALSGYCDTRSGRTIAFSILMNSVASSTTARYRQDRIAARIAAL